jgi:hypothetical protein
MTSSLYVAGLRIYLDPAAFDDVILVGAVGAVVGGEEEDSCILPPDGAERAGEQTVGESSSCLPSK